MQKPEISIIVPVYNRSEYLKECLDSAVDQTLKEVEIICVNDCSTDNSPQILHEYAERDPRIKVIDLDRNVGTFCARKIGVAAASGKYVLFCDADDVLTSDACEKLCQAVKEKDCELLMFSVGCFGASPQENQRFEQGYKNIFSGKMENPELLGVYFDMQHLKLRLSVWGWLFPTGLLQKTCRLFPDFYGCFAEDSILLFAVMALCRNADGVDGKYYRYRRNSGITSFTNSFDAAKSVLNAFFEVQRVLDGVLSELESEYCSAEQIQTALRTFLLTQSKYICHWRLRRPGLNFDEEVELMKYYFDHVDREAFVYGMACKLKNTPPEDWLDRLDASGIVPKNIPFKFAPGKTIGLTTVRSFDGIERCIGGMCKIFLRMGMNVVVISSDEGNIANAEFELPPEVEQCTISTDCGLRVLQLHEIVKKEKIDIIYAQSYDMVFPDVLTCKILAGIPFITHWHNVFSEQIRAASDFSWLHAQQRKFCDLTVCLSPSDELFFRACGVKARYLLNPPSFKIEEAVPHPHNRPLRTILFLARLHPEVKRTRDVIDIMKEVLQTIPDARALIVGGVTPGYPREAEDLAARIEAEGLTGHVILCGAHTEVKQFYAQADVFLSTSVVEGFQLTLIEALAHGLSVVSYDLPYLACRAFPDNGIVPVPMCDTRRAAVEICRILQNEDLHRKLSEDARRLAEKISSVDYIKEWRDIFAGLERGGAEFLAIGEAQMKFLPMMLETLRMHTLIGVKQKRVRDIAPLKKQKMALEKENKKLEQKNKKLDRMKKEYDRVKKSRSYRWGRALTWLPRKLRGGVRCLLDHGLKYTLRRILQKLHIVR